MCMNGRKYLGNAPTLSRRPEDSHALRRSRAWVNRFTRFIFTAIAGSSSVHLARLPSRSNRARKSKPYRSSKIQLCSDPVAHFAFTIEEGKGIDATPIRHLGEWHMHCHVPMHMMEGMVGSLLVIDGGEAALPLPSRSRLSACASQNLRRQPSRRSRYGGSRSLPHHSIRPSLRSKSGDYVEWINADRGCDAFGSREIRRLRIDSSRSWTDMGSASFSRQALMTTTASSITTNGGIRPVTILLRISALSRNRAAAEALPRHIRPRRRRHATWLSRAPGFHHPRSQSKPATPCGGPIRTTLLMTPWLTITQRGVRRTCLRAQCGHASSHNPAHSVTIATFIRR